MNTHVLNDHEFEIFSQRFLFIKKLGEGKTGTVYLARDKYDQHRQVAIKFLKNENISHRIHDIIRFQTEAGIVSGLSHPNIIRIHELGEINNLHYLVMEYFPGDSLRIHLDNDSVNTYELAVDIIIKCCEALSYIHEKNIIHKALNPNNILVSIGEQTSTLRELKLTDFGIAQLAGFNDSGLPAMTGTLNYLAPEQTGVLRRRIDERSDLYALGILFYEMLARRVPFTGTSMNAIIYQHLAKKPEPFRNFTAAVPLLLEKIVLKLLEKEQDDRYQSAEGLLNDLWRYKNGCTDFIPGLNDKALKLYYTTRLVGREEELAELKRGFTNLLKKNGNIYLIKGEAGVGKTRLVEEFNNYVSSRGKICITGKAFIGKNKVPYGPFKEALNEYVKEFIRHTPDKKSEIKEKMREFVKESGEILLKLNSHLQEVIGVCPPLAPLESEREQQKFIAFCSQFLVNLGELENGLVLFLDDMQWLDEGSFELLTALAGEIAQHPLMILGTYRDRELADGHSLLRWKEKCKTMDFPLKEISVTGLTRTETNQFIAALLYHTQENTEEITQFIFDKSKGNPFFVLEILKQMITEKSIIHSGSLWRINHDILAGMEIFNNVVDILLKRLALLSNESRQLLSYVAMIGRKFDIELLFELGKSLAGTAETDRKISEIIEQAKELQLLEEDVRIKGRLSFVHDRIREALYQETEETERRKLHNTIGYALERLHPKPYSEIVFELAYHFLEAENDEKSIQYAFLAGMKAKENYANEEALKYLLLVKTKYEKLNKVKDATWIEYTEAVGEVYLLVGKINEALELYGELLPLLENRYGKAKIYMKMSLAYFKKWDYENCELCGKRGLALLGENLPAGKYQVLVQISGELLVHMLHNLCPGIFIHKKETTQGIEKYKMISWFYYSLVWVYRFTDLLKFVHLAVRSLNIAESRAGFLQMELGLAMTAYASFLMAIPVFKKSYQYFRKSLAIRKANNDIWGIGQSYQLMGVMFQLRGQLCKSVEFLKKSIAIMKKIGDIKEVAFSLQVLKSNYRLLGDYNQACLLNREFYKLSKKSADYYGMSQALVFNAGLNYERGRLSAAQRWLARAKKIITNHHIMPLGVFEELVCSGLIALQQEKLTQALEYFEKARALYETHYMLQGNTCLIYTYLAETSLAQAAKSRIGSPGKKAALEKTAWYCKKALKKNRAWKIQHGPALLVYAGYQAAIKKVKKARQYFLKSIACSEKSGGKFMQAKAYYEYGKFLENMHEKEPARVNWEKAYTVFKKFDSRLYLAKITKLLNLEALENNPIPDLLTRLLDEEANSRFIDLSRDILACKDINLLLDKTMQIILELTNAERGCLIVRNRETNDLEILNCRSVECGEIPFKDFSLTIIFRVMNTGETVITGDAAGEKAEELSRSIIRYGVESIFCFPVCYQGKIQGACYLDNRLSGFVFSPQAERLNLLLAQVLLMMENISYGRIVRRISVDENYLAGKCSEFGISRREKEILLLVIKGLTNKEISEKKYISLSTLKTHLNNIYKKTNIYGRHELIELFSRINPPPF